MNVVIPFRNTCGDKELKMCIQLIKKNLKMDYNNIYILGDYCGFDDDDIVKNIIVKEQKYNKWLDSNFLVMYYITNISKEEFLLFNDDFFLTEPIYEIFNYFCGTVSTRILTTYVINEGTCSLRPSAYGLNLLNFEDNFGDFRNYEVHIPMRVEYPELMAMAIDYSKEFDCPALKRTIYMKILEDRDMEVISKSMGREYDCKFGEPLRIMQYPFFSLTDKEFKAFEDDLNNILLSEDE
jgi:hypothetical protein